MSNARCFHADDRPAGLTLCRVRFLYVLMLPPEGLRLGSTPHAGSQAARLPAAGCLGCLRRCLQCDPPPSLGSAIGAGTGSPAQLHGEVPALCILQRPAAAHAPLAHHLLQGDEHAALAGSGRVGDWVCQWGIGSRVERSKLYDAAWPWLAPGTRGALLAQHMQQLACGTAGLMANNLGQWQTMLTLKESRRQLCAMNTSTSTCTC